MPITLIITDDNAQLLETWKYILGFNSEFQVIATCMTGEEAVEQVVKLRPDIVIMDNNMPGISGIEATRLIHKSTPGTKILGFSLHSDPNYARKFMEAGASGYIEKTASVKTIIDTLLNIYHNRASSINHPF